MGRVSDEPALSLVEGGLEAVEHQVHAPGESSDPGLSGDHVFAPVEVSWLKLRGSNAVLTFDFASNSEWA